MNALSRPWLDRLKLKLTAIRNWLDDCTPQLSKLKDVAAVILASGGSTTLLVCFGAAGWLDSIETQAWDWMVRLRPSAGPDPNLAIVEITEDDLQRYNWPLPDEVVARLLDRLQAYHPSVIGLDIYRPAPRAGLEGWNQLVGQLRADNTVVIANYGNNEDDRVSAPASVPPHRVGFNDLSQDPDTVIRRWILFGPALHKGEEAAQSFPLRLAQLYLADLGIQSRVSSVDGASLQLGKATFVRLEAGSGGYGKVDARGYQVLLDYRSSEDLAEKFTLAQLLQGQVDRHQIEDKIVIIGSTAPSLRDLFATPYSAVEKDNFKMPGVMVHAQIVSQIVGAAMGDRPLFWFWPQWAEVVWIGLWAVTSAVWAQRISHPVVLGVGMLAVAGTAAAASFGLFLAHAWVPVVAPMLAIALSGSSVVAYQAYQAQRQQGIVMKLLGQSTSPEIADALWDRRSELMRSGKLQGQKLVATMLFTDIKGFSTISEQMSPERLLEWLNEYLGALTKEVQNHQGIINKFTGDGLMAVFGVPVARTSRDAIARDATNAVRCGLAFGGALADLNRNWQQRGLPVIQMRVGIFTGPIVAGSLGGQERMEYGIIGDSVNTASRLESCEKDRQPSICRVLIAQETLDLLGGAFTVEPWGPKALKGRQQTVNVYRVVSVRDDTRAF